MIIVMITIAVVVVIEVSVVTIVVMVYGGKLFLYTHPYEKGFHICLCVDCFLISISTKIVVFVSKVFGRMCLITNASMKL